MYAIITGASQGLGKSFAIELARRGSNLILISLPNQKLIEVARHLKNTFDVKVETVETDLSIKENVFDLANWVNKNFKVNFLVNNAGIGGSQSFENVNSVYLEKIIKLNILATTLLTHRLLPNLKQHSHSYILNVASLAALTPIAYKTVYPASKAFIYSFSRGLCEELRNTNISVSVVNPGAMSTNKEVRERIQKLGFLGRLTLLNPDKVARKSIKGILKRDNVIVVNPLSYLALRIIPIWIKLPLMSKAVKREIS